jgi:hypothetical protein
MSAHTVLIHRMFSIITILITRTWRATDVAGNYSECVQTITVQDVTNPIITCPGDVTVNCQDNSSSATGVATAVDNCADAANIAITQSDVSTYSADPSNVRITTTPSQEHGEQQILQATIASVFKRSLYRM